MAKKQKKRPGVLVRFYETDLAELNAAVAADCTPRENFIRRLVLVELQRRKDKPGKGRQPGPP